MAERPWKFESSRPHQILGGEGRRLTAPRTLGFWTCLALVMGNMIGAGIFLLPAALAPLGWNAIAGWVVAIAGALCLAFVFARLAGRFPEAGGPYVYAREAFGPATAFAVAWSYWISVWAATPAIALAALSYLAYFAPALSPWSAPLAIVAVWLFTALNCASMRGAGAVQIATTIAKLLPLVAAIALGIILAVGVGGENEGPAPGWPPSGIALAGIGAAAALALWAMLGFEAATVPAGHVRDPARTIPRATMIGTLAVGAVYLAAYCAIAFSLPADTVAASPAPFADFIARFWHAGLASLVALLAAVSALGALNGWILVQGMLPLALARDGAFPSWFGRVSKSGIPVNAQLVSSGLATLLLVANASKSTAHLFVFMLLLSTAASLFGYLICALGALRLARQDRLEARPALLGCAIAGSLFSLFALAGAGIEPVGWGLALLASGLPIYAAMRRKAARLSDSPPPTIPSH